MTFDDTFLAAGQRYIRADLASWRADQQITVVQVESDRNRCARVTYRNPNGREVSGSAAEFEVSVMVGEIVPVAGFGVIVNC